VGIKGEVPCNQEREVSGELQFKSGLAGDAVFGEDRKIGLIICCMGEIYPFIKGICKGCIKEPLILSVCVPAASSSNSCSYITSGAI
jgi:hypothetical protein